jgi:bifunctional enzyme CysN/CysC
MSSLEQSGMLRLLTAGSVDDGKSTLIGRLLYESNGIYEDQLDSVHKASKRTGREMDLSLITDGLKAEREQAITIDVAYRYFSTAKRKFIIADTPGHEQYTRNMVTGASTADLAILLVDARKGLLEQTRRHAYVVWQLGIRQVIVAVNKMDLVNYDQGVFDAVCQAFIEVAAFVHDFVTYFLPLSALAGDNVVRRSDKMPWYSGPALLELLEIILHRQKLRQAIPPQSVILTLSDHLDLGRGDMLAFPEQLPTISNRFRAELIWMSPTPLVKHIPYLLKHLTQILCCSVIEVLHCVDVHNFSHKTADTLHLNEIGSVEIETHKPMFFDLYTANRSMGNFILLDPATNDTVAAGVVSANSNTPHAGVTAHRSNGKAVGSEGLIVWFTGLSGAGKTTICTAAYTELLAHGLRVELLDADVIRQHLNSDLGFSAKDRDENVRRIGFIAHMLARHGVIVLVAAISPYRSVREELRRTIPNFIEVYVNAPLELCEQRDPKGLYKRARRKEITGFTGIDDPYQPPLSPDVECRTDQESIKASKTRVVAAVLDFFDPGSRQKRNGVRVH